MAKKTAGPRLPAFSRGASSANPDRVPGRKAHRSGGSLRDKATIKRLKLYTGGKVKRDKQGVVVEGDLARRDRAGNAEITGATGRVAPDRRWFGNTRTIKPEALDKFRHELREARREQTARAAPARHAKKLIMEMGPPDQWHKEEIEAAKARAAALKSAEAKRESDAASARSRAAQQRAELAAKAAERSGHAPLVKWT